MVKTHFASSYESVTQCIESLGEAWMSHPLFFPTPTQQFARCLFRALEHVWLQVEMYESQDLVFIPKSKDGLLELVADFVTAELVSEKDADPLSRHTSFSANVIMSDAVTAELAQLSLCSVSDADTRAEKDQAAAALPHSRPSDPAVPHAGHGTLDSVLRLVWGSAAYTYDEKAATSAALTANWNARSPAVSSLRSNSTSRSSPPEPFHGHASDNGQTAQLWLYSLHLYVEADVTLNPVAEAVTYLHGDARYWWQQVGSRVMPPVPTFPDFAAVLLARFVKPSDSAKARVELPTLKQTSSVEAFASHFRSVNSRITVGSPIDTTSLANQRQASQCICCSLLPEHDARS